MNLDNSNFKGPWLSSRDRKFKNKSGYFCSGRNVGFSEIHVHISAFAISRSLLERPEKLRMHIFVVCVTVNSLFCIRNMILSWIIYFAKLIIKIILSDLSIFITCDAVIPSLLFRITQTCDQFLIILVDELNYRNYRMISKETKFGLIYFNSSPNYLGYNYW